MLRRRFLATAIVAALAACAASAVHANAVGNLADVHVIDRASGETIPVYVHDGRRYVAGTPGRRYAIAMRNRTGGRVLAVVSVDGVNAVTGETAAWDQAGYVFEPWQRWEIRGWRKSHERVAAFEFAAMPDSYAARTGRPQHVGVIGVALFREAPPPAAAWRRGEAEDNGAAQRSAPASPAAAESAERREALKLGTGHGRSEHSPVSSTPFVRAHATPDEVIAIHYDSRDNLIAMGVIPAPRPAPRPNPFPGVVGFVPDPPR